ncbi:hypothetical protein ACP275_12G022100 [Erythranthe tilingii]
MEDITKVVTVTEQFVKEFQYALDSVITELSDELGPDAVPSMMNQSVPEGALPPPEPDLERAPLVPIRVPNGIPNGVLALMIEQIGQLDTQHKEQLKRFRLMSRVVNHVAWTWYSYQHSYDSTMYDYVAPVVPIVTLYTHRINDAIESFRTNWEHLRWKLDGCAAADCAAASPPADGAMPFPPRDHWLLTVNKFQDMLMEYE